MSKAILIMDMPKCCSDCRYCNNKKSKNPSCALTNYADGFQNVTLENIHNARQSWCLLVPMPSHMNEDKGMKSYDNDMFEESTGIYTVEITLQQREYVGHITQIVSSDCKGLEILDFNFENEDGDLNNDCNLKYDEKSEYFSATLMNPEGNTLDVEGYANEFNNMIVKIEIVDYRKEEVS